MGKVQCTPQKIEPFNVRGDRGREGSWMKKGWAFISVACLATVFCFFF